MQSWAELWWLLSLEEWDERLKIAFACARLSDRHSRNFSPHHTFYLYRSLSFLGHLETPSHKLQEWNSRIRSKVWRVQKMYKNRRENQAIVRGRERDGCRLEKLEIIDFVCLMSVILDLVFSLASWHIRQKLLIPSVSSVCWTKLCQDFFVPQLTLNTLKTFFLYLFSLSLTVFFSRFFFFFVFRSKCITLNVSWIFFMFFFLVLAPRWIILHFCRHQTVLWHWWWRREKEISNYAADFFGSESFFPFAIFRDKI